MPLNKSIIGKKYVAEPVIVSQHESMYYGLACNDDNDAYFDKRRPGGIIAPPMFATNYASGPTMQIIFDPEVGLNIMMIIHLTQEYEWLAPVRPNDTVRATAEITHVDVQRHGAVLGWKTETRNQNDEVVVRSRWEFFDRSAGDKEAATPREPKAEPGEIAWTQEMKVRNGQSFIYAEPSGDHNPIHVDDETAKKVGLPGIILQGLCTMAFAHKAAVDNLCGPERDPLKVRKLKVQFARAVIPGQTLVFKGFRMGDEEGRVKYGIIAENDKGKAVLSNSWCLIG